MPDVSVYHHLSSQVNDGYDFDVALICQVIDSLSTLLTTLSLCTEDTLRINGRYISFTQVEINCWTRNFNSSATDSSHL